MELKQLRKSKGLSQQQLAELSGVIQQTISNIERGFTQNPKLNDYKALTKVLGDDFEPTKIEKPKPKKSIKRKPKSREEEIESIRELF